MADNSYLERCIETVAELRKQDIASMTRGEYIGEGSTFRVHSLGQIGLNGTTHIGLKLPKPPRKGQSLMRLSQEATIIDKILEKAPSAKDKPPLFMGLLAIGNDDLDNDIAVITEDVTKGLTLPIWPTPAAWPEELARGLGGEYGNHIDEEVIRGSMAFEVGGTERWLDFTPSPFGLQSISNPIYEDMLVIDERQEDLTVTIPVNSPLALSLE